MLTVVKGTSNCTNSKLLTKGKNTAYYDVCRALVSSAPQKLKAHLLATASFKCQHGMPTQRPES